MDRGFVSFFSGALGLDLGLERAGLIPLAANEVDRAAVQTIRLNRPCVPLFDCDIRALTVDRVLNVAGERPFAVVGGPPCQAFSTAGRRSGLADARGNVFFHFIELALGLEPRFIVIENVRGLLSAAHEHRPVSQRGKGKPPLLACERAGSALLSIVRALEKGGYGVSFQLYNVANFGVPQLRERLVLIASANGTFCPHLQPTHEKSDWKSFREAVAGLTHLGECAALRSGREKYFRLIGPGENWRFLPLDLQREALGGAYDSSGGRVGFCRRLAWDRPSPTLVTSPTMPATELVHPEEMRPLSINEYKRVQTFPDEWEVSGSVADRYRQIGNAVPVQFAEQVGRHLIAASADLTPTKDRGTAVSRYHRTCERTWSRLSA